MRQISLIDFAPLTGTDWTASLKEAIAYLKARYGGGVLVVPGETYKISHTITISQVRGLQIRGEGSITTDFEWAGDRTRPMFTFNRTQGCYLENISITAPSAFPLLEGVRIQQGENDAADPQWPGLTSSRVTVRDCIFRGQAYLGTACRVYLYDVNNDDKNDHHRFERLQIAGCTHAALVPEGRNPKAVHLDQIEMIGTVGDTEVCDYGVLTVANLCPLTLNVDGTPGALGDPSVNGGAPVYNHGASFTAIGGQWSGNTVANILLGSHTDSILVQGIHSSASGRWLHVPAYPDTVSGMNLASPVTLDSCRYEAGANTPADGELVIFEADGPLIIRGCNWTDQTTDQQHHIRLESNVPPSTFVFEGNSLPDTQALRAVDGHRLRCVGALRDRRQSAPVRDPGGAARLRDLRRGYGRLPVPADDYVRRSPRQERIAVHHRQRL